MSRTFNGSTQWLTYTGVAVSGQPATFSSRAYASAINRYQVLVCEGRDNATAYLLRNIVYASNVVEAVSLGNNAGNTTTVGTVSQNTWFGAAATFGPSVQYAWKDGTKSSSASYVAPGAMTYTTIGVEQLSTTYFPWQGRIADVGLYAAVLTDQDVVALNAGWCPLLVSPSALRSYWPLGGAMGNSDADRVGPATMTPVGSPTWGDHPKTIYPCDAQCC